MSSETVADRIRTLMNQSSCDSERDFAQTIGVPYSTLKGVLDGSRPSVDKVVRIADAMRISIEWLATGREATPPAQSHTPPLAAPPARDLIDVPRFDVSLSAGYGSFVDRAERLDSIPFPTDFFTRRLGRKPDGMIIVDAQGDSMLPTVADRDLVMIDTADQRMTGAVWAFTYEDGVFVKRINVLPDALEVRSDNAKDYPSFIIDGPRLERMHLIGRVVWVGRTL
ncbi:S24 family peptidase [Paracoccus sp. (in: a-proteobacteria)]|uniref:XRE family transcriptional regulator n=1 Tax=Paracoccus sp. TaxID=267 RepID=UPI0026E0F529|nr:S24 family peptidase [Paracoccus sp. (in: a-proteobacteria)]MDO5648712.1 S24 family peptidase [Paracoccus sp. (in: a-proteobacteria)]